MYFVLFFSDSDCESTALTLSCETTIPHKKPHVKTVRLIKKKDK